MSRAPRRKAYCTFCENVRALLASGHPVRHNAHLQQSLCNGCRYEAQPCPTCAGTDNATECLACEGTGRIVK